jgi:hypothetical protein
MLAYNRYPKIKPGKNISVLYLITPNIIKKTIEDIMRLGTAGINNR